MYTKPAIGLLAVTLLFVLIGCSGSGGSGTPVTPGLQEMRDVSGPSASQHLWGFWDVTLDKDTGQFELIPLRDALFQANVTGFLQPPSNPIHLLTIMIDPGLTDMANGYIVCDVTARHPFPGLPQYRGFDVKGIVMGDGTHMGESGNGELWPALTDLRLLNADGYSRWWNPTEFTTYGTILGYVEGKLAPPALVDGTVNAYKYYADGFDAEAPMDDLNLDMRGTFSPLDGANTRRYVLQFPMAGGEPVFKFNYAITASYLDPIDDSDPNYPLESYAPESNQSEAFRINVTDVGSSAFYENPSSFGGNLNLSVEVFDWGFGGTSVVTDEISEITLESPTLFTGHQFVDLGTGMEGTSAYSYQFSVTVPDVTPTGTEDQEILVRVISTEPADYEPEIPGITGFAYPAVPLTAYYLWEAEISDSTGENAPEVGVVDGPAAVLEGDTELYTLSYATDVEDGTFLTILWDNDGDLDFNDDTDGDDTNLEGLLEFPTAGDVQVIARAVDSSLLYTDSAPFDVVVEYCPTDIHDNFQYKMLGDAPGSNYWKMANAFIPTGDYAGQVLVQRAALQLYRYDVTQASPWFGNLFITLAPPAGPSDFVAQLDACDYSGRFVLHASNGSMGASTWQAYDDEGTFLSNFYLPGGLNLNAMDTNNNGDVYIVTSSPGLPGGSGSNYIYHYEYGENSPYYNQIPANTEDISTILQGNCEVFDIAISYSLQKLYLLRGYPGNYIAPFGELYCWDIQEDGSLVLDTTIQNLAVFPTIVHGAFPWNFGILVDGGIEIDHSAEVSDQCRLVVMAQSYAGGHYFGLLDYEANVVDMELITPYARRYHFCLRQSEDPTERYIFTSGYSAGSVYLADPPAGW